MFPTSLTTLPTFLPSLLLKALSDNDYLADAISRSVASASRVSSRLLSMWAAASGKSSESTPASFST